MLDFFCEVRGAVETCKGPVSVDEADDKGDGVGVPARVVFKVREDETGGSVRGSGAGDRDENGGEGEEGEPEREGCDAGEVTAVAVKDEGEGIDELVG